MSPIRKPWPNPRALRWKIAALCAAVGITVAAAVGVLVHQLTFSRDQEEARHVTLNLLKEEVDSHRSGQPGNNDQDRTPKVLPPGLLSQLSRGDGPFTHYSDTGIDAPERQGPTMWAAERVDGHVVAVDTTLQPQYRKLQSLDKHMVLAAAVVLAVTMPLAALAADLPARRLRRVAHTARRISHGDLDARIGAPPPRTPGNEVADISASVDQMANQLQGRLQDEQRFTADVAHELRTPLAGLVMAVGLLPEGEATELVQDRVRAVRGLVEELLEVSRLDAGAEISEPQEVPLGHVVAEAVRVTGAGADVTVTVRRDAVVQTDPRRLNRILANLLANALRHGRPPVEVVVDGRDITVRDHGPGYPEELLAHGPQRFRTGAPERGGGHGLGLTIALGQARVIGATLRFTNAAEGGAVATLTLPADR
ncbi:ATP-binding protein [Streptomyces gamaensis]|uniref:histidine kinase n=1 Tax=Streptomyces gamaensis TaxID=1763542 RepID=A0ABW0Z088_9ACTN